MRPSSKDAAKNIKVRDLKPTKDPKGSNKADSGSTTPPPKSGWKAGLGRYSVAGTRAVRCSEPISFQVSANLLVDLERNLSRNGREDRKGFVAAVSDRRIPCVSVGGGYLRD